MCDILNALYNAYVSDKVYPGFSVLQQKRSEELRLGKPIPKREKRVREFRACPTLITLNLSMNLTYKILSVGQ